MKPTRLALMCSTLLLTAHAALATETPAAKTAPPAAAPVKVIETITDDTKGAPMGEVIETNMLTRESLTRFYDTSKRIHLKPYNEYLAFMNRYTSPDVQLTLNITNNMPGQPTRKQTLIMNKTQFIDSLHDSYQASQGASVTHKLTGMDIAKDGQTAVAKDVTMFSNTMVVPGSDKTLQLESQSSCEDSFKVGTGSQPLMTKSVCSTEIYIFNK